MRDWTRDAPELDAEEASIDTRPILGRCEICGKEIHGSDSTSLPDEAYCFDGNYVCYDHLHEYFHENIIT